MAKIDWSIEGPHFANCNCDYGCPCQFVALPTDGTCKAVVGWRIDKGHFGDVRLDGLNAASLYSWPGAVHQGNGTMQVIVDERADESQRAAVVSILQGEHAEEGGHAHPDDDFNGHVPNTVTSLLAAYRGYDTMFELVVIYCAGTAVMAVLRRRDDEADGKEDES